MTKRQVRFTATAQLHVEREKAWWIQHRDYLAVFAEELEQAIDVLAVLPGAGTVYARSPVAGVRRLYLRRVDLHLYYTFKGFVRRLAIVYLICTLIGPFHAIHAVLEAQFY